MNPELTQSYVVYVAKTKLLELGVEVAETKNWNKVQDEINRGIKIRLWLEALSYSSFLTKAVIDRLVYQLADLCDANAVPLAPSVIQTIQDSADGSGGGNTPPSIVVGIKGDKGDTGDTGPEGGGVPFSMTSVTQDTVIDSFSITESRGVEYTVNLYDDSAGAMRITHINGGWTADGSTYGDTGGWGETIVGDCSDISLSIIVVGTEVRLMATVTDGTWTVEGTRKYVPNNGNGITTPTTLAEGKIWVGNGSSTPTAVTLSGDVTITSAGVTAIGSGVIVNADINSAAAIALSKLAALTASRAVVTNSSGVMTVSDVTATEIGYLDGVTSNIQTQLDSKLSSASGAISTVVSTNLTASRAIISNASGKIAVSAVTDTELSVLDGITATTTELNYTDGVTSNIQTQLNAKAPLASPALTGNPTAPTQSQGDNSTRLSTTAYVDTAIAALEVESGTYTPTMANPTNLVPGSSDTFQWMRVGNVVTVSGRANASIVSNSTTTAFSLTLPVASNLTAHELVGSATYDNGGGENFACILRSDITNNLARTLFTSQQSGQTQFFCHFTYLVN